MKIATLTTGSGVVTVATLNYLPAYLYYIAATQLTGLKVTVAGDGVICDLDAAGLNAVSGVRRYGAVANSYMVPLADGFVPNKVVEITFTNSATQTPDVYGFSLQKGTAYMVSRIQKVLASSGATFENFAQIAFSSPTTTDEINVGFVDGHVQKFVNVELLGWYTLYSNETDSYCIDNIEGEIDYVNIIPSTDRTCYLLRYAPIGEVI
jgi:prepilin-type processing-associated H-X9-DG protein